MSQTNIEPAIIEYLAECDDLIQKINQNLQSLEKNHSDDKVDSLYRDIHTIKGSSQLFGYNQIGEIAHAMESSLEPIRKKKKEIHSKLSEILFKCIDTIEKILQSIKTNEVQNFSDSISTLVSQLAQLSAESNQILNSDQTSSNENFPSPLSPPVTSQENADSAATIRVPVALLDKLMTLMGEMVLVRNQVLQYANKNDNLEFLNLSQRLDVVTSEIQGEVMKTRMQPIGNILSKFQRVVRDLSKNLNKKIDLNLFGIETELDKTLLEAVKDPIMHIVRNSCDHGIESPEERKASGKADGGNISIKSFHEGGQVIVEISDDGRGLNKQKLINKAIEKGLIGADKGATLSERDAYALIFAPGFSTAAQVTDVSGRGVGMDVVKNNIEGIGGMVELQSQLGKGTRTRLKIPLTLAIVPAMIIRCEKDLFAIPQVKLIELVRVEKGGSSGNIEYLQGKPIYRLRGNLLPLVNLKEVLNLNSSATSESSANSDITNIVVLNAENQLFGLIVDEVQDTAEVVVKPLSTFLKGLSIYSGATVLGDGSVALILDIVGIARQQHLLNQEGAKASAYNKSDSVEKISNESQEFLLFRLNSPAKHCIPLNLVHRLEEFKKTSIEYSGAQRVVRYRNCALPIISLNEHLGFPEQTQGESSDTISVIVAQKSSRLYGIEVNEILDVLNTTDPMDDSLSDRPGILANLVSSQEIIIVIDALRVLEHFVNKLSPQTNTNQGSIDSKNDNSTKNILLVEDTAFFRKHIQAVLERAKFNVTCAEDGQAALTLLEESSNNDFDIILSDIEMPKMNGLQLATAVRKLEKWNHIPMIAITTKYNDDFIEEGKNAGFDSYLEKLKADVLLNEIQLHLKSSNRKKKAA